MPLFGSASYSRRDAAARASSAAKRRGADAKDGNPERKRPTPRRARTSPAKGDNSRIENVFNRYTFKRMSMPDANRRIDRAGLHPHMKEAFKAELREYDDPHRNSAGLTSKELNEAFDRIRKNKRDMFREREIDILRKQFER